MMRFHRLAYYLQCSLDIVIGYAFNKRDSSIENITVSRGWTLDEIFSGWQF